MGQLYVPGLAGVALPSEQVIVVEVAREADVLWAMEEGLRSGCLAAVVGVGGAVAATPARRLALAARENTTACLLLTPPGTSGAFSALTRWRIGRARSAPCLAGTQAPGIPRLTLTLDRCRQGGRPIATTHTFLLDWCHEASCFRLASALAYRADEAGQHRRHAG
jgi:protein ImuA